MSIFKKWTEYEEMTIDQESEESFVRSNIIKTIVRLLLKPAILLLERKGY